MKHFLPSWFRRKPESMPIAPPPPPRNDRAAILEAASEQMAIARAREAAAAEDYFERVGELMEAVHMAGSGPLRASQMVIDESNAVILRAVKHYESRSGSRLREDSMSAPMSIGAYGDIELALQNVEWRRQVNLSWMEFSRWGIQQIILVSRLYWMKNPIVRRLVNVCAAYVFARGVEVTTNSPDANDVWKDFVERNPCFGHVGLTNAERAKDTDGNLYWVFFADAASTGKVSARVIDATEISEIVSDPNDSQKTWLYRRDWDSCQFDLASGSQRTEHATAWYPALDYEPTEKPATINGNPVLWDQLVYHRKDGSGKFGVPRAYPMLDWARESRRFLEACASVRQNLSQIVMTLTTKGGQQAIEGAKAQLSTTIGPSTSPWDQNPPAVRGATFASGPGTKLEAFKVSGATFSPEDCRQYKLMCCMVAGVPETFLGDVSTGNLATATSLDRPTETGFKDKQEAWIEDLTRIATHVISVSSRAPSGRIREAFGSAPLTIEMCRRKFLPDGTKVWEAMEPAKKSGKIEVQVNFPSIREGDVPALVASTVKAMTLDSRGGQVVGIDEKEGVKLLYRQLGIEDGDEMAEKQYPDSKYEPDRSEQEIAPPVPKINPGGQPQFGPAATGVPEVTNEALREAAARLLRAADALESKGNTHA